MSRQEHVAGHCVSSSLSFRSPTLRGLGVIWNGTKVPPGTAVPVSAAVRWDHFFSSRAGIFECGFHRVVDGALQVREH